MNLYFMRYKFDSKPAQRCNKAVWRLGKCSSGAIGKLNGIAML